MYVVWSRQAFWHFYQWKRLVVFMFSSRNRTPTGQEWFYINRETVSNKSWRLHEETRTGESFYTGLTSWFHIAFSCCMFFRRPMTNMTTPSWIDENCACSTRSGPPGGRFHIQGSGYFAFTWHWRRTEVKITPARKSPRCHVNNPWQLLPI